MKNIQYLLGILTIDLHVALSCIEIIEIVRSNDKMWRRSSLPMDMKDTREHNSYRDCAGLKTSGCEPKLPYSRLGHTALLVNVS